MNTNPDIRENDALPPWGDLDSGSIDTLDSSKLPAHWLFERSKDARERHFVRWWFDTLGLINDQLWPRYNRRAKSWEGRSVEFMSDLTVADLQLMVNIQQPSSGGRQFDRYITSRIRPAGDITHRTLFEKEDESNGANIFGNFSGYNRHTDDKTLLAIRALGKAGDGFKQTPVAYLFKRVLQRPRPMQMALRFGFRDFGYEGATSAMTPSMLSGHCIQGLLSGGTVIERLLEDRLLTDDLRCTLPQWAVDIGDRRVLAGVHYPTDSLCSWVIFLRMADFVYAALHASEVKQLLGDAIRTKSYIYRHMVDFARTKEGKVYEKPLELLDKSFGSAPVPEIDPPCAPANAIDGF